MKIEQRDWRRQIDGLLANWRATQTIQETKFLREFRGFVESVTCVSPIDGIRVTSEEDYEQLIDVGAGACAVMAMLSPEAGFMISRGGDGVYMATLMLPFNGVEATASARTGGLALAGAVLLSMAEARGLHNIGGASGSATSH